MPASFTGRKFSAHLERYRGTAHWRGTTIADSVRTLAARAPDRVVFFGTAPAYTAARVAGDAESLAASLLGMGVQPGDVVSFQLPNWPEAAVINVACALIGAVVVPIVPIYRDLEVGQMLADSGSRVHFTTPVYRNFDYAAMLTRLAARSPPPQHIVLVRGTPDAAENSVGINSYAGLIEAGCGLRPAWPKVHSDAIKLLLYTSGTTGKPKGVIHTHDTLACFIDSCARHWRVAPDEPLLMPSPVTHITGYGFGLEMPFLAGTRTLLMEAWNAEDATRLIDQHGIVGTVSATPFLQELSETARRMATRLPTLRFFGCGGAAVPPEVVRMANATFEQACAFRVFGCSEAPMVTLGYIGREHAELAATTDGAPVDYEVRIVDEQGHTLPQGSAGEILVRGPAMLFGYVDDAQTREAITVDGYFRTGDLGMLAESGALIVTGRKKDLIIRGGENISPKEIEDVLHRHPGIAEAAVVGMPHPRLGEGVCACVVPRPGYDVDAAAVIAYVTSSGMARQKCPERVEILTSLPKTASGKVRKDILRAAIREHITTAS